MRKAAPKILDALSEDVKQPLADKDPLMENAWGTAFAEETQQHQRINVSSEDIDLKLNQGMSFAEETQQHQRINVSSGDIDLKLNQSLHQLPIALSNGQHIYLQSHDHGTYVGMCGNAVARAPPSRGVEPRPEHQQATPGGPANLVASILQ